MSESRVTAVHQKSQFFPALDGLRTLAVAMVFGVHFTPKFMPFGWLGVQLFLVLSGFLITGILFDTRDDAHRFSNFYLRRALRIFPLYYGILLLWLFFLLVTNSPMLQHFWLWFVYLQNFWWLVATPPLSDVLSTTGGHAFGVVGHFWSLAVEEQFYLLWPLVIFTLRNRLALLRLSVVLIAARMGLAIYWQYHLPAHILENGLIYRMLPTQCDAFLCGGILALLRRGSKPLNPAKAGTFAFCALAGYLLVLGVLHWRPALIGGQDVLDYRYSFQAILGLPLSNLVFTFLIFAALQPETWVYKFCALRWMQWLGRISYGLYVFHLPVFVIVSPAILHLCKHVGVPKLHVPLAAAAATACTISLSYLSFHYYEKRFLMLKERFTKTKNRDVSQLSPNA